MEQFRDINDPIAILYRNEMTPNALEVCFGQIITNISISELVVFDDFIYNCFGAEDELHMDNRDPETILNTLRIDHNALFCQLCERAYTVGRLIFQQFSELDDMPITREEQIKMILTEFSMVFQHFYPNKFNDDFIKEVEKIPFYESNAIVEQATNRFLLTAASIFCTMEHENQIRTLLTPLQ